jgi:protein-disulfide isomerase
MRNMLSVDRGRPGLRTATLVAALAVGSVGGVWLGRSTVGGGGAMPVREQSLAVGASPIPGHSPRRGAKLPKVTFVQVSDFQCPFCAKVAPAIREMESRFPSEVAFVFVHLPLPAHAEARAAAIASMAAARQGKFWEYRDKLFDNPKALASTDLERYARELRLDVARFKKDAADQAVIEQIHGDERLAKRLGVTGTPTFFINGRKVAGAQPVGAFKALIELEIRKANALAAKGTPAAELSKVLTEEQLRRAGT